MVSKMMKINLISKLHDFSILVLAQLILTVCSNIHTLTLTVKWETSNDFHNEIARLKKLKNLEVTADRARDLKRVTLIAFKIFPTLLISSQIVRDCRQVEILWMNVTWLVETDLAKLEPAENMTDVTLCWMNDSSIEQVLSVLKRWQRVNRLALVNNLRNGIKNLKNGISVPPLEVLSDFIIGMKHLSHLRIVPHYDDANYGHLEILSDQVNEFILPRRPNFKFDISPILD